MIDKTLFPRLKRLFSNDVIIRNVGGKSLRVADINKVQAFGNLQSNSLVDRYTRMHMSNNRLHYNPYMNYQTLRTQLYADYEGMDGDGIIASVLDIISEESTLKGETNEVLTIRSTNEDIQKVLYNLFYDVLNIEFNLPMWIRSMCKYGDFFLHLQLAEQFGITGVKPLSVYDVERVEGTDADNPNRVIFQFDPTRATNGMVGGKNKKELESYEVAHFRLITDTNFLPYGRAYIEPARKYFKQYSLMLDAMLLHRIMRAPEKRIFYINVGNIPPNEVSAFVQAQIDQMKKTPYVDPHTGDYNLKFNVQNMMEDFYIPIRPGDTTTKIDTAKGLEYAGIEDVEFLRDLMLGSLKLPKAFLNYSDELNGKSTISALDIRFGRTIERLQRIVISELNRLAYIHLYIQGYEGSDMVNFELGLNTPSIIYEQEKIALLKEKIGLTKDIMDSKFLPTDYMYDKIWKMSEDEMLEYRELLIEDQKRAFRHKQIEEEGNDPAETGISYGTPHDLASIYKKNASPLEDELPDGYDEKKPGRPKEKDSIFHSDDSAFGRDPLGQKDMKSKGSEDSLTYKNKPRAMALERQLKQRVTQSRPCMLFENEIQPAGGLLSEENIMDDLQP